MIDKLGRRRHRLAEKRERGICLKLSDIELDRFHTLADILGMSVSMMIRYLVMRELGNRR